MTDVLARERRGRSETQTQRHREGRVKMQAETVHKLKNSRVGRRQEGRSGATGGVRPCRLLDSGRRTPEA